MRGCEDESPEGEPPDEDQHERVHVGRRHHLVHGADLGEEEAGVCDRTLERTIFLPVAKQAGSVSPTSENCPNTDDQWQVLASE